MTLGLQSNAALQYSSCSIAIFIELIIAALIFDIARWNEFMKCIFSIAVLDILNFVCLNVATYYFILDLETGDNDIYECHTYCRGRIYSLLASFVFLFWSITVSLVMSYGVYHLLNNSKIFDLWNSNFRWVFYALLVLPLFASIMCSILLPFDFSDPTSGDVIAYDVGFKFTLYSPIVLVFANFTLFFCSRNRANKLFFSVQGTATQPPHQTAIEVLVKRMKYFPIIQSIIYLRYIFGLVVEVYELTVIFPLCSLAFLILFLLMQPTALDHLKYRLGLSGKPVDSKSIPPRNNVSKAAMSSLEESSHHDSTVAPVDYDNMADDELERIIDRSSSFDSDIQFNIRLPANN